MADALATQRECRWPTQQSSGAERRDGRWRKKHLPDMKGASSAFRRRPTWLSLFEMRVRLAVDGVLVHVSLLVWSRDAPMGMVTDVGVLGCCWPMGPFCSRVSNTFQEMYMVVSYLFALT